MQNAERLTPLHKLLEKQGKRPRRTHSSLQTLPAPNRPTDEHEHFGEGVERRISITGLPGAFTSVSIL